MARQMIAPPEEDPNATILSASPPCFMHELDPTYLGYLAQGEVAALLEDLLVVEWPVGLLEKAWIRAMLKRHLAALQGVPASNTAGGEPVDGHSGCMTERLRRALPRLQDHALRGDLEELLGILDREQQDRASKCGAAQTAPAWPEVRRWRKAQRESLIIRRLAASLDERKARNALIGERLQSVIAEGSASRLIGFYWPFKGEYDPRPLMRMLHQQGVGLALPVVAERAQPLVFRRWWPGMRMVRGIWDIPVPAEGDPVSPDTVVAPLVGFDPSGYRLGYGGGYYDRTLAAMPERPLVIGVGFELSCMETIHPQPHDIPMDVIITEQLTLRLNTSTDRGRGSGR
jgi:5-formyltetrahydrofolate cyclo-ligase